jgi:hypothetical protein
MEYILGAGPWADEEPELPVPGGADPYQPV